jgi:hypothetical protein
MKMKWNKKNLERDKENEDEEFYKQLQEPKIESKFDKQLQESEEELKSDSQNNWLKKDDDDEDIIDYVWESNTGIKKQDDEEMN